MKTPTWNALHELLCQLHQIRTVFNVTQGYRLPSGLESCVCVSVYEDLEGDDGYLYGLFLSFSIRLPNRMVYGYITVPRKHLRTDISFQKIIPLSKFVLTFFIKANRKHTFTHNTATQHYTDCLSGFSTHTHRWLQSSYWHLSGMTQSTIVTINTETLNKVETANRKKRNVTTL